MDNEETKDKSGDYKVRWNHVSYTEPWSITLNTKEFQKDLYKTYYKKTVWEDGSVSYDLVNCNFFQKNWKRFKLFIWRMKRKITKI